VISVEGGVFMRVGVISLMLGGFIISAASPGRAARTEEEGDQQMLEATWKVVEAELAGNKLPEEVTKKWRLTLRGDRYFLTGTESDDEGTTKLMPDEKPRAMDITGTKGPNKGKTFLTIYELKDDHLKVCYDLAGKKRPTEFATKAGTMLFLVTYQKEKK
jgi:uncharacterized protein (TIGR03067 family)